ncbi:MAG: Fic family protein [Gemmataceae bacterium]
MDEKQFSKDSPGSLVRATSMTGLDWAFVPNSLSAYTFDSTLWPLIAKSHASLGTLNGIGQTLNEPRLLLKPLQNREAITSSRIEGTYVTPEQLILFELNPPEKSEQEKSSVTDWIEVHNYGLALTTGVRLLDEMPLCNRLLKEMHKVLMRGVRGKEKTPGEFRKQQVQIGYNARFVPPPPTEVSRLMDELEKQINSQTDIDPLIKCFLVHYQFETIHPFLDGNGRIGRALLSLMIYKEMGHKWPWLYMSAYYDKNKDDYINSLYNVSSKNHWSHWLDFCLRGLISQADDSIRRCNEFNRLKKEYHERVTNPTPRTHQIIEDLFIEPFLNLTGLAKKCGVTYPTAKSDVDLLMKHEILFELSHKKPKVFYAKEVFTTAYRD